jgi:hypothetical protein
MATPESQVMRQRKRSDYGFHQVGVHCVVEVCIHIVIKPVSVGVSIWLAGARSVVLLLTIGSGVLGGNREYVLDPTLRHGSL